MVNGHGLFNPSNSDSNYDTSIHNCQKGLKRKNEEMTFIRERAPPKEAQKQLS